jgi:hypothetical protein
MAAAASTEKKRLKKCLDFMDDPHFVMVKKMRLYSLESNGISN